MRKHLRLWLLLWVMGYLLFFSCGALAAADSYAEYPSGDLGRTDAITDLSGKFGEQTPYNPFGETGKDGIGGPPPHYALAANIGDQWGLWLYDQYIGWSQWTIGSPNLMVSDEGWGVVANFPGYGLYLGGSNWTLLTPNDSVENVVATSGNIYCDFGSLGLWQYNKNYGTWAQISVANPDKMHAHTSAIGIQLVANFPGDGLYQYDATSWTLLTSNSSVENLVGIRGAVFADFGSLGLWVYAWYGKWIKLSDSKPNMMQDIGGYLVANFPGHGLYLYQGYYWIQLTPDDTVQALIGVSGNLYADYGPLGLWRYNGSWARLTSADANLLGSYDGYLVANFPGYGGLYQYSEYYSDWAPLTDNMDNGIIDMLGIRFY